MQPIRLYYFRRKDGGRNFGDDLSPAVVAAVTGRAVVHARLVEADVAAIGSILDRALRHRKWRLLRGRFSPLRLWGSGFISEGPQRSPWGLAPLAVRGPLTRDRFALPADTPLGDPGLLFPDLLPARPPARHAWGVVPHYEDEASPLVDALCERLKAVRIPVSREDPLDTLRGIASCARIVSSSLHGLIAADAFGIPNWRVSFDHDLKGGDYKFRDYALPIGRTDYTATASVSFDPATAPADFAYTAGLAPHQDRLRAALRDGF